MADAGGLWDLLNPTNTSSIEDAAPLDFEVASPITGVEIAEFMCSSYRGIILLSLPGKDYAGVLEKRVRPIVEPPI